MNREFLELVSDTLTHIKETHYIYRQLPVKREPSPSKPKPKPETKAAVKVSTLQVQPLREKTEPLIFDKIHKHLPHLKLIKEIPKICQAAIVAFNPDDLPFLKNLAKAIQERYCPVKLLDGNKISSSENWKYFNLVITQKKLTTDKQIILESIATYQNNTEQKKLLWSTICQYLSPKLS